MGWHRYVVQYCAVLEYTSTYSSSQCSVLHTATPRVPHNQDPALSVGIAYTDQQISTVSSQRHSFWCQQHRGFRENHARKMFSPRVLFSLNYCMVKIAGTSHTIESTVPYLPDSSLVHLPPQMNTSRTITLNISIAFFPF